MDPLFRPLAALLNRGIQDSASARRACEELEGRSLDVQLERAGLQLRITISGGEAVVGPATDEGADATLAGNLLGFNRLVFGDAADAIRSGLVKLSGDADTAEAFQSLLADARPDAEEELSRIIGDVAAHQVGEAARSFTGWARGAAESFSRSLTEYLQEERRDLPTRYEMDKFLADVDELNNDVERAAARVARLKEHADT